MFDETKDLSDCEVAAMRLCDKLIRALWRLDIDTTEEQLYYDALLSGERMAITDNTEVGNRFSGYRSWSLLLEHLLFLLDGALRKRRMHWTGERK